MIAHRIRLYPTAAQERALCRWREAARLAWNWALSESDRQHRDRVGGRAFIRRRGKWVPVGPEWQADEGSVREDLDRLATRVRRRGCLWWMVEPPARVYRSEFRVLREAWRRCREGLARRPVPKRYAGGFGLSNQDVQFDGRGARVPKLGWIRTAERVRWRGRVKTARVTREADAWYLSVNLDWERRRRPAPVCSAGLDVGVKTLAVLASADGKIVERFANPRGAAALARRVRRAGRAVSRRSRGSSNRRKAVLRLARLHQRAAAVRREATETVSTCVARRVRRVGVEDLAIKGMLRGSRFAGAVADAAMARLRERVGVKVLEAGGEVSVAPRSYPSTRLCSQCGARTARIPRGHAGLRVRRWTCESCGAVHDRDLNAARNLDPSAWSGGDAASWAESENACGDVCQERALVRSGDVDEAGSAIARNPHAGTTSSSVGGALADGAVTRVVAGACAESVAGAAAPG